jgi:hypothetical protein
MGASQILTVLLTKRDASDGQLIAEQRDLILYKRERRVRQRRRRRDDGSANGATICGSYNAVSEVAGLRRKVVYDVVVQAVCKEVEATCKWGRALKPHRPEGGILASIVEIYVAVLNDDGLASGFPNDTEDLLKRVRMAAAVLAG